MTNLKTFGDCIRAVRKERKMTQIELAKASGLSVNSIRLYESGKHNPKMDSLKQLADALEVEVTELIPYASPATVTRQEIEEQLGFDPFSGSSGQLVDVDADVVLEMLKAINQASADNPDVKPVDLKIYNIDLDEPISSRERLLEYFDAMSPAGQKCAVESVKLLSEQPAFMQIPGRMNRKKPEDE